MRLPHLYDSHMMAQYKGASFGELSPHPFAVADAAYRYLLAVVLITVNTFSKRNCMQDLFFRFQTYDERWNKSIDIGEWGKWGW